ncbi:hypothetical protein Tco_0862830 [Tanacetum coccineum]
MTLRLMMHFHANLSLNDKSSLSEYDEEEQNVLYFNDLFPFNIICSDDLKSEKDNDNNETDMVQPFENYEYTSGSTKPFGTSHDKNTKDFRTGSFVINIIVIWIYYANGMLFLLIKNLCAPFGVSFDPKRYYKDGVCAIMLRRPRGDPVGFKLCISIRHMAPLPPREQRHRFLRYEGLEYTDADITDFEGRLERIHMREIHRVLRRMLDIRGPLVHELILEFFSTFRFGQALLDLDTPGVLQFQLGGARRRISWKKFIVALRLHTKEEMQTPSIAGRSQAPEKVIMTDLFYLRGMDIGSVNVPYLLARYLRMFAAGRKSGAHISRGQFVARLVDHFGLLTTEILGGLTVIAPELSMIDMAELVRLQICVKIDDTWAWVALGPKRQPDAATGAPAKVDDVSIVDKGGQADSAPVQAPQQPPPPPPPPTPARTMPQRMARLEGDIHEIHGELTKHREVIDTMARDFFKFSTWVITSMGRMMDRARVTYTPYSQTYVPYQRRVRRRTGEASTSTAQ